MIKKKSFFYSNNLSYIFSLVFVCVQHIFISNIIFGIIFYYNIEKKIAKNVEKNCEQKSCSRNKKQMNFIASIQSYIMILALNSVH